MTAQASAMDRLRKAAEACRDCPHNVWAWHEAERKFMDAVSHDLILTLFQRIDELQWQLDSMREQEDRRK